jgi:hypothetical protein
MNRGKGLLVRCHGSVVIIFGFYLFYGCNYLEHFLSIDFEGYTWVFIALLRTLMDDL